MSTSTITKEQREDAGFKRTRRRAIAASAIGTALEWFDFSVFAALATIIGAQFFESDDPVHSFLSAVAVFGVGFLFRPLGALFFGHIGDVYGRHKALALTIIIMGFSTLLLAVAPNRESIGVMAPVLLVAARIGQGFSAGGEFAGGAAFIVEYAPPAKRGLYGSIHYMALIFGNLIGAVLVAILLRVLSEDQMSQFGWRIPFASGLVVAVLGFWMRRKLSDTPAFALESDSRETSPLASVARNQKMQILRGAGLVVGFTIASYTYVNMQGFVVTFGDLSPIDVSLMYSLSLAVHIPLIGIFGAISDRVGRRPVMLVGIVAVGLSVFPTFALVTSGSVWLGFLGLILMAVSIGIYAGPFTAAITEMMPIATRYSSISISYGLAVAIFGGTAGYVVAFLRERTGGTTASALFCVAAVCVTFATVLRMRETAPSLDSHKKQDA